MVSSVNSHTNATRIGWHLWEIDWRFAPGLPPGWLYLGGSDVEDGALEERRALGQLLLPLRREEVPERVCVCVCVTESEGVCERGRASVCVCERERESEGVCVIERERGCVCVSQLLPPLRREEVPEERERVLY